MTMVKGLFEASVMLFVALAVAAISALSWITIGDGNFAGRMGTCLIILGLVLAITADSGISRMASADAFAWLGRGPEIEKGNERGGRILTGLGIFLFVAVPLVALGAMMLG
jgi:hypothetical protein